MADSGRRPLHSRPQWAVFVLGLGAAAILLPFLNLGVDPESPFHVPDHFIPLLGKYLCFAMVALAIDLIWGFTGILSLGHGTFFALGGYAMGMYLMRSIGAEGVYSSHLPDFMVFLDWKELPWYWYGFDHFAFAVAMAILVPAALAYLFGWLAFRSRITGVYFSIITQAMTFAFMLLFFRNDTGFGGNNGLTDFKRILDFPINLPTTRISLYLASVLALTGVYLLCRFIVKSKLGRLLAAIRDSEGKVLFTGYDTLQYKLFVWTLSAGICGLAGALYVPQVGIINPSEMQPANSIEMAIWVAVGGRGTLGGAMLGAWLVNAMKSYFTVAAPELWLYVLGGTFIAVTLWLPQGVVGLRLPGRRRAGQRAGEESGSAESEEEEGPDA
jgi:urea transport system permease protein